MNKIYSELKFMHFPTKLDSLLKGDLTAPIHVRIKPTNLCNQACYYCCYRNKKLYLSEEFDRHDLIPWDKMKEIITDLRSMGVKAVTLSGGGEPLFYPQIRECIEALSKGKIKIGILTNGSLLNGRIADLIAKRVSWLRVSMDSANPLSYAKNRGVKEKEFNQVIDNLRNFVHINGNSCLLGVNFIVTKDNYKDIYRYLRLMKNIGVSNVKICECVVSVDPAVNRRYLNSFLMPAKKEIHKAVENLLNGNFMIIDKLPSKNNPSESFNKYYDKCLFSNFLTVIGADMNVYSCQDKAYTRKGLLFSIKKASFREMWFSARNKKRLERINPSSDCLHHCTQHAKNLLLNEYCMIDSGHLGFV